MEEIKIGEYARTNNGHIGKITKIECAGEGTRYAGEFITDTIYELDYQRRIKTRDIVKHSKNIIDLIEVGDYVNGERMDIVERDENGHVYYLQNIELPSVNKNEIESIVTKEQFKSIEYKI